MYIHIDISISNSNEYFSINQHNLKTSTVVIISLRYVYINRLLCHFRYFTLKPHEIILEMLFFKSDMI